MKDSAQFMMIFKFEPNNDYQPTAEEMAQQQQLWGGFIGNLAIKEKLVSTNQLGFTGRRIDAGLTVSEGIDVSGGSTLGGNMVVRAKNIDEAAEMAKDCPILAMGGTVEVRDILPM